MNKAPALRPKNRRILYLVIVVIAVALGVIVWVARPWTKNNSTNQDATIFSVDEGLRQNGAARVCSANAGSSGLTSNSTDVVYQIGKNRSDTAVLIKKVGADNGYGDLAFTTNGSADFYSGDNKTAGTTITFIVYNDRKFTNGCEPSPSTDPSQTAFMLSITKR